MKENHRKILLILTWIVVALSAISALAYLININQNAFSLCELVICAYCALSIFLKFKTFINTDKMASGKSDQ